MVRIILATLVGAVVLQVWGVLAWMVFELHDASIGGLPNAADVTATLQAGEIESGFYVYPWSDDAEEWSNPDSEWYAAHRAGPLYQIVYRSEGGEPMDNGTMVRGFLINCAAVLLASFLLSGAAQGGCRVYWQRVGFVLALGLFVGVTAHLNYWNWMGYPLDYTLAFIIDLAIAWTLVGLLLAAIIRPKPSAGQEAVSG